MYCDFYLLRFVSDSWFKIYRKYICVFLFSWSSPVIILFGCLLLLLYKKCKHALTYLVPGKKPPTIHIDQDEDKNIPIADGLMNPRHYDKCHDCL